MFKNSYIQSIIGSLEYGNLGDIIATNLMTFNLIFAISLAYCIYWKISRPLMANFLRKSLNEAEKITEIKLK